MYEIHKGYILSDFLYIFAVIMLHKIYNQIYSPDKRNKNENFLKCFKMERKSVGGDAANKVLCQIYIWSITFRNDHLQNVRACDIRVGRNPLFNYL
jgi:hypothetical protein